MIKDEIVPETAKNWWTWKRSLHCFLVFSLRY